MTAKKTAKKTAKTTTSPSTGSPDTGSPDTATPDTAGPEPDVTSSADAPSGDAADGAAGSGSQPEQPLVKLPEPTAGPQLDTRPGHPRVCKAPHCGLRIEKRGLCGYHWATKRSLADPA